MIRPRTAAVALTIALVGFVPCRATAQPTLYAVGFGSKTLATVDPTSASTLAAYTTTAKMSPFGIDFLKGNLYAWDQNASRIRQLNPTSGTFLKTIDIGSKATGEGDLAFNYSTGLGYLTSLSDGLTEFDLSVPSSKVIGVPAQLIDGLAWDTTTGTMYALEQGGANLHTLDLATATLTKVGATGVPAGYVVGGLAFHPTTGTLYAALSTAVPGPPFATDFYTINKATGAATKIGTNTNYDFSGIRFSGGPVPPQPQPKPQPGPGPGPISNPGEGSFKGVDPPNKSGSEGKFGGGGILPSPLPSVQPAAPMLAGPYLETAPPWKTPAPAWLKAEPPSNTQLQVVNVSGQGNAAGSGAQAAAAPAGYLGWAVLAALAAVGTVALGRKVLLS